MARMAKRSPHWKSFPAFSRETAVSRRSGKVPVQRRFAAVAAAILAAVEGGILPPEMGTVHAEVTAKSARKFAGQDARLYGRRDARRYAK